MKRLHAAAFVLAALICGGSFADSPPDGGGAAPEAAALAPELEALYRDLHQHPELAFHEMGSLSRRPSCSSSLSDTGSNAL